MFVGGFGDGWAVFVCLQGLFWFCFVVFKDLAQVDFNLCCTADLQGEFLIEEFLIEVDSDSVRLQLCGGTGDEGTPALRWGEGPPEPTQG